MIPLFLAKQLVIGDKVRVLEPTGGGDHEGREWEFPAGMVGEITNIETLPAPQLYAVTVAIPCGDGEHFVVNIFDEADYGGLYPLEKL